MKTSELIGENLNWAAARAANLTVYPSKQRRWMLKDYGDFNHRHGTPWWNPSMSWAQGGWIIQREKISIWARGNEWAAESFVLNEQGHEETGKTPLIAAMRCYVVSKLGDEVTVPTELLVAREN
jgi:hypothetical protein